MLSSVLVVTLLACLVAIYASETLLRGLTGLREQPDLVQCFSPSCTPPNFATRGFHVTNAWSAAVANENTELGDTIRLMRIRRIDGILASVGSRTDVHTW
jgi:hypothetical protein